MAFPTSKTTFTDPTSSDNLNNPDHATLHTDINDTVEALEDKVGIGSSTASSDTYLKGNGTGTSEWSAITNILASAYPVGSIYINATSSTNPATLLGFGTWTAFGAGKVMVGIDSEDEDFDTAEETGGEKTHTLTTAEMPTHNHSGAASLKKNVQGSTGNEVYGGSSGGTAGSKDFGGVNAGSGDAHNNVQPYIVVYMWKRTE